MIRFDTIDRKPKVWNIAVLTAAAAVVMAVLLSREETSFHAVGGLLCLYLFLVVVFLAAAFVKQLRYNPYSYNTIYYSGFALFAASVFLSQVSIMVRFRMITVAGSEDLLYLFNVLLGSARSYMTLSMPFIALFSAGLCLSNISLIRHEGKRIVNLLGILLSFLMIGGELFLYLSTRPADLSWEVYKIRALLTNLFAALYLYYECMLIGTILANLIVLQYRPAKNVDDLIILGCGLKKDGTPTPLLAGRIDRAIAFYEEQLRETGKAPVLVCSGGKGPDEVMSEGASMKAYLMERGIPEDRILVEDRSRDTYENMLFSKDLIADDSAKVAFSTTNYHVFRSGLMARRVRMRAVGIGAKTKWYFWPNATVREFVGILTEHRLKQALILGGMVLVYCISTVLYFL